MRDGHRKVTSSLVGIFRLLIPVFEKLQRQVKAGLKVVRTRASLRLEEYGFEGLYLGCDVCSGQRTSVPVGDDVLDAMDEVREIDGDGETDSWELAEYDGVSRYCTRPISVLVSSMGDRLTWKRDEEETGADSSMFSSSSLNDEWDEGGEGIGAYLCWNW